MDAPFPLIPPAGYTARPCRTEDAPGVLAVVNALELALDGETEVDLGDIVGDWAAPSFDLATRSIGIFRGDELVANAEVRHRRAEVVVHPAHRGRGLGAALVVWTEAVARRCGVDRLHQLVSERDLAAAALLGDRGYEVVGHSWILKIDLADAPAQPSLPPGYGFSAFVPGRDDHALFDVIEKSFRDIPNRDDRTFDEWWPHVVGRDDFDPALVSLVTHDGGIVAAAIGFRVGDEGWVTQLGVRRDHRRQGLGRAMLEESFRRFRDLGLVLGGLNTNTDTGALGLYERAGLRIAISWARREKVL